MGLKQHVHSHTFLLFPLAYWSPFMTNKSFSTFVYVCVLWQPIVLVQNTAALRWTTTATRHSFMPSAITTGIRCTSMTFRSGVCIVIYRVVHEVFFYFLNNCVRPHPILIIFGMHLPEWICNKMAVFLKTSCSVCVVICLWPQYTMTSWRFGARFKCSKHLPLASTYMH